MSIQKPCIGSIARIAVPFEGSLLILAFGLGRLLDSPPFEHLHLCWHTIVWGVFATLPLLLLLLWCTHSRWGPFVRIVREVERDLLPLFENCSLVDLALLSVVAGVAEEALFRGVIQTSLTSLLSPARAIGVTGVLFGLVHLITPAYAVLAGLVGIYLGWLMVASGNLLLPVVVHVLYDFLALAYAVRLLKSDVSGVIHCGG